nr:unnamed protein product [Digitaria exilis]
MTSNRPESVAVAAFPPWVLFEHPCTVEALGCSSSIADTKTMAASRSTTGLPVTVSLRLRLAAPPELSRVCVQVELPARCHVSTVNHIYSIVVAAHGDSMLVQIKGVDNFTTDHFVYNAGNAAADPPRPPSLRLLPRYGLREDGRAGCRSYLNREATGLLRSGEDELVVAELNTLDVHGLMTPGMTTTELRLLRYPGSCRWSVKRTQISHHHAGAGELPSSWRNDTVVPLGDDRLCWVDFQHGLLFCDVFEESPELRFVPLPEDPFFDGVGYRNVSVTAGGAMKLVNIFPRCCCGGAGRSYCRRSHHAYTIHTWTLTTHSMTWVKDGTIDATQIWDMDGYKGFSLPRVELELPVVSLDEPHVICFVVCEDRHVVGDGDKTIWMIMVDMRSGTLRSAFRYPEEWGYVGRHLLLPSRVSECFNSEPSSSGGSKLGRPLQAGTVPNRGGVAVQCTYASIFTGDDLGRS